MDKNKLKTWFEGIANEIEKQFLAVGMAKPFVQISYRNRINLVPLEGLGDDYSQMKRAAKHCIAKFESDTALALLRGIAASADADPDSPVKNMEIIELIMDSPAYHARQIWKVIRTEGKLPKIKKLSETPYTGGELI